jgi:hypothetical protein
VAVTPSIINLGRVRPGETISKTNIAHVRSATPFALTKLTPNRPELETIETNPTPLADHVLNLKLRAPETSGPYHAVVQIETDLKEEPPVQLKVFATVAPPQ